MQENSNYLIVFFNIKAYNLSNRCVKLTHFFGGDYMRYNTKKFLIFLLAVCMVINFIGESLLISVEATSIASKGPLDLKRILSADVKIPDKSAMLKLAERYYYEAIKKADTTEKEYIAYIIDWKVEFTGKNASPDKAKKLSYPNSYLINYTNMKNLYTAVSSAAVAIDYDSSTAIGNLASAVITYGEDSFDKKSKDFEKNINQYRQDAASLYTYSLFLVSNKKQDKSNAVTQILNLGHLYIDMGKVNDSKKLFDEAFAIDENYMPSREGLAAYYLAKGDKKKAEKIIEDGKPLYIASKIRKANEDSSEKNAPSVEGSDSLAVIEQKIDKLNQVKLLNAAEFFESLDSDEVKKVVKFVDNIKSEIKYTAPSITMISQYSTLESIKSPMGKVALEAYAQGMGIEYDKAYKVNYDLHLDMMKNLGLDVDMNFDINDVLKNPEKYENFTPEINISGIEKLQSDMKEYSNQIGQGIEQGDSKEILEIASKFSPKLRVLTLNPRDYSNPTDILTQIYNLTVLNKKLHAIRMYSFTEQQKDSEILADIQEKLALTLHYIEEAMDLALSQVVCTHGSTTDYCDICTIKIHNIHSNFYPQINNASQIVWKQASDYMSVRYLQYVKPKAESIYKSAMGNVMLISDPKVRTEVENDLKDGIYALVNSTITNVLVAYDFAPYKPISHCGCDLEAIHAALERERKAFDAAEFERTIKETKATWEFKQGIIPEGSPLYAKLDSYATTISTPFVEGRISPMKTNVKYKFEIPGVPVSASYDKVEDRNRNTTTRGGGISVSGDKSFAGDTMSVKGSVSLRGEVTTDGNANITSVDVIGTAEAGATAGVLQATGTYEASVMRGCKYSGEVAATTEKVLQIPEEAGALIEAPTKILWQGEYKKK